MPKRNHQPNNDLHKLGKLIRRVRHDRTLTIAELAAQANVSNRTIIDLEAGTKKGVRYDAIVRLAAFFSLSEAEQSEWLALAGHANLAAGDVNRILDSQAQRRAGLIESPEMEPVEFLKELSSKVQSRVTLMCVWYTSPPVAAVSPEQREMVLGALKSGLWVALVCPYPAETPVALASLRAHYNTVICGVRELALGLRRTLGAEFESRIAVFEPATQEQLVAPPMRLAEYRPALLHYNDATPEADELGVYVRLGLGARERWLRIYSPEWKEGPNKESALTALKTWQDYLADILKAWEPSGAGWEREKLKEGHWKLVLG